MSDLSVFENFIEEAFVPAEIEEPALLSLMSNERIKEVMKLDRDNPEHVAIIKREIGLSEEQDIPYSHSTDFYLGVTLTTSPKLIAFTPTIKRGEVVEPNVLR